MDSLPSAAEDCLLLQKPMRVSKDLFVLLQHLVADNGQRQVST